MNTKDVMKEAEEVINQADESMKRVDESMRRSDVVMKRADIVMKEAEEFIGMFHEACQTFQRTNDLQAFDEILEYVRINGKI